MKKRIMLADDDESVRKMVARVLESVGYAVTQVRSSREAAMEAEKCRPDLAILDLQTPDKEGWAVLESVTRLAPVMPVVALTTWSNQQERATRGGIDALLEKPLDLLLLLDTIRELLAKSEMRAVAHSAEALCQASACPSSL